MANINLSGVKGQCGQDGYGAHGYGQNGGNAGPASDGTHGGVAYLRITRVPDVATAILVSGTVHQIPFN